MTTTLDVEPEFRESLSAAGLATFRGFMDVVAGPAASEHRLRSTAPLDLQINGSPKRFFLKRNYRIPPRHAITPLLRLQPGFSQPRREWDVLGELAAAGIPAMRRVASGERRVAGIPVESFLLVEAVPFEYTLEDWLVPGFAKPQQLSDEARHELLESLGRLVRSLRDTGFCWPDIHPKHIFAEPRAAGGWEFYLIDVERMTRNRSTHNANDWPDLSELFRRMRPFRLDQSDLDRIRAGYGEPPAIAAEPMPPRLPDDYEHPRAIQMEQFGGLTRDKRAAERLKRAGLNSLEDVFHHQSGHSLSKPGLKAHRDRCRLDLQNGDGMVHTYYLKRYRSPPFIEQVRRIREAGPDLSTAKREMRAARKLREIGIATLQVTAFGQEMSGPWERRSFVLTDGIGGVSLERMLLDARKDPSRLPSWKDRREIIEQLAAIVRLLHRHRLFHRDLYLCHFLLTRNADRGIVLRVIDLARMIERPIRDQRWRIKDLAALEYSAWAPLVTRTDRLRFLKLYFGQDISRDSLKREMSFIHARARRMAKHDQPSSPVESYA